MSQQIQITGGAKVRDLQDVIIGTSGVLSSLGFDVANGVPKLDSNGKILVSQLPNSVMEYKGTWNAATNTPTLANGTGNQGDVYLCNVAGTVNFGAGPIAFIVGDSAVYSGSIWQRSGGATGTVTSVAASITGSAIGITGSPITTAGTLAFAFSGTSAQYINGAGNLVTFPTIVTEAQRLVTEVYNETGATLTKGTVVYINGGHGNLPTITKAIATGDATSAQTYGIVQTDITNNNNGYVVVIGSLMDLDTQAYANGTQLYLSSTTAGAWTSTKQYAPAHLVYVGIVTRSHPTQGVVEVRIQNGFEMDELHNVSAQSPLNNQGLFYNTSTSLWENKSIATALGYTPANDANVVHLTGNETIGGTKTFSDATKNNGGIFLQNASSSSLAGYMNLGGLTNGVKFTSGGGISNSFTLPSATGYTFTFPNATGTIALTSDISYPVTSVFGRTGAVVATSGDYTTTQVTEGTNFYFTDARARASISVITPLTYNSSTGVLNINQSSTTVSGWLSFTDFNTFNNKQAQLNGTGFVKASGTTISYDNTTYLPLTGGTLTGNLSFSQPYGPLFANGQYIKDNSSGGLVIYSGAAVNITATSLTINSNTVLDSSNYNSYALPLTGGTLTGALNINLSSGTAMNVAGNAIFRGDTGVGTPRQLIIQSGGSTPVYLEAKGYGANYQTDFGIRTYNSVGTAFEVFYATSSGNVGINQVSPSYLLDVNGTGRFSGALIGTSAGFSSSITATTFGSTSTNGAVFTSSAATTNAVYGYINNTSGRFYFGSESSTGGTITTGSTAYYGQIAAQGLQISANTGNNVHATFLPTGFIYFGALPSVLSYVKYNFNVGTDLNIGFRNNSGICTIEATNDGVNANVPIQFAGDGYIFGGGNIRMGTAVDSGYKLDVVGTGRFSSSVTAASYYGQALTTSSQYAINLNNSIDNQINLSGNARLSIVDYVGNYLMVVKPNGLVAIGNSSPTGNYKLQVSGLGGVLATGTGSGDSSVLSINDSGGLHFAAITANALKFFVQNNGTVNSTSATITLITSDRNLKTDIIDYDKGLAEVLAMKPRYYKYKDNLEKQEIGFIAQEMDEALKGSMIDSIIKNKETNENYKTYKVEWYPLLVKAIQEQQKQIEELKLKIK